MLTYFVEYKHTATLWILLLVLIAGGFACIPMIPQGAAAAGGGAATGTVNGGGGTPTVNGGGGAATVNGGGGR
ncbi:hypothetical protein QR680_016360 [Steinernema hermaphroditum]|uniref:Uncharacterized protein n=1 Tax=Steinernema hermaphroditum TaxID=289476 RepID=A0AA39HAZ6_9BILA|nr:hypothetical protein QR680_016360 [Steinernema hermaphroditum]